MIFRRERKKCVQSQGQCVGLTLMRTMNIKKIFYGGIFHENFVEWREIVLENMSLKKFS